MTKRAEYPARSALSSDELRTKFNRALIGVWRELCPHMSVDGTKRAGSDAPEQASSVDVGKVDQPNG